MFVEPTRLGLRLFCHCAGLFSPKSGFKLHARAYHSAAQLLRNVSALSEARFHEEAELGRGALRAFDKAV